MVKPSSLSLPNVFNEYLKVDLEFQLSFLLNCKLNEIFSVQPFNPSFGQTMQVVFVLN